jgi:hypothetical protein
MKPIKDQFAQFLAVTENIAAGDSIAAACRAAKVAERSFFAALAADADGALGQAYARARRYRADQRVSAIEDLARRACLPKDHRDYLEPNAARVAIDSLKWLASRENQSRYGERVLIEETAPKAISTREEALATLRNSGLSVSDIFGTLTTKAEPLALDASPCANTSDRI